MTTLYSKLDGSLSPVSSLFTLSPFLLPKYDALDEGDKGELELIQQAMQKLQNELANRPSRESYQWKETQAVEEYNLLTDRLELIGGRLHKLKVDVFPNARREVARIQAQGIPITEELKLLQNQEDTIAKILLLCGLTVENVLETPRVERELRDMLDQRDFSVIITYQEIAAAKIRQQERFESYQQQLRSAERTFDACSKHMEKIRDEIKDLKKLRKELFVRVQLLRKALASTDALKDQIRVFEERAHKILL